MLAQEDFRNGRENVAIIGLGYVGLPLATLMARQYRVVGFDINERRVAELKDGIDRTREVDSSTLDSCGITFTHSVSDISGCRLVIVTVPTPISKDRTPDLRPIEGASELIGKQLVPGSVVVYESTVYPGVTEDICVPILETESGLSWKVDFHVGYSPERINPGDREHTIDKIQKVVAGDTANVGKFLADIYDAVIIAGVHLVSNIKTAEAAKVIENTQRDLNIALMNELAIIFNKIGIDTQEVLEAAGTKWNFLRFDPGLVGGHCIGVDPYYLTSKAESVGYHPEIILAGRRINDSMGKYVAVSTIKELIKKGKTVKGSKVLLLGLTFKENISDIRNTKVVDILIELADYEVQTYVHDPLAYKEEVKKQLNIDLIADINDYQPYDAVILAVPHTFYVDSLDFDKLRTLSAGNEPILVDVKGIYSKEEAHKMGFSYWRL